MPGRTYHPGQGNVWLQSRPRWPSYKPSEGPSWTVCRTKTSYIELQNQKYAETMSGNCSTEIGVNIYVFWECLMVLYNPFLRSPAERVPETIHSIASRHSELTSIQPRPSIKAPSSGSICLRHVLCSLADHSQQLEQLVPFQESITVSGRCGPPHWREFACPLPCKDRTDKKRASQRWSWSSLSSWKSQTAQSSSTA